MNRLLEYGWPTLLVAAACLGLAAANCVRPEPLACAMVIAGALAVAAAGERCRLVCAGVILLVTGLWWVAHVSTGSIEACSRGASASAQRLWW